MESNLTPEERALEEIGGQNLELENPLILGPGQRVLVKHRTGVMLKGVITDVKDCHVFPGGVITDCSTYYEVVIEQGEVSGEGIDQSGRRIIIPSNYVEPRANI